MTQNSNLWYKYVTKPWAPVHEQFSISTNQTYSQQYYGKEKCGVMQLIPVPNKDREKVSDYCGCMICCETVTGQAVEHASMMVRPLYEIH